VIQKSNNNNNKKAAYTLPHLCRSPQKSTCVQEMKTRIMWYRFTFLSHRIMNPNSICYILRNARRLISQSCIDRVNLSPQIRFSTVIWYLCLSVCLSVCLSLRKESCKTALIRCSFVLIIAVCGIVVFFCVRIIASLICPNGPNATILQLLKFSSSSSSRLSLSLLHTLNQSTAVRTDWLLSS